MFHFLNEPSNHLLDKLIKQVLLVCKQFKLCLRRTFIEASLTNTQVDSIQLIHEHQSENRKMLKLLGKIERFLLTGQYRGA